MNRPIRLTLFAVVALSAVAAGWFVSQRRHAPDPTGPSPAAEIFYAQRLPDAAGVERAMSVHRGKAVLVNFWATWCVPCVEEIPLLSRVHAEHAGRIAFVGVGIDSAAHIAGFDARFRPSYPLVVAGASGTELARAFGDNAGALPYTVLLGPDGRILASHLGKVDEAMLQKWLAPFVASGQMPRAAAGTPSAR